MACGGSRVLLSEEEVHPLVLLGEETGLADVGSDLSQDVLTDGERGWWPKRSHPWKRRDREQGRTPLRATASVV